jgi:hypothetical protein
MSVATMIRAEPSETSSGWRPGNRSSRPLREHTMVVHCDAVAGVLTPIASVFGLSTGCLDQFAVSRWDLHDCPDTIDQLTATPQNGDR